MNNKWVIFLIVLGAFFLSLMGWSFYLAGSGVSRVTDKEYSVHGHRYAEIDRGLAAAVAQGWKIVCERQGGQLTVQLSGDDGKPVGGAQGRIEFLNPGSGAPLLTAQMREIETGLYIVDLPSGKGKEVSGNLSISKGLSLFRKKVVILL